MIKEFYEKYIEMEDSGQFSSLTVEDMIWIDNNVKEDLTTEQEGVGLYKGR